MSFFHACSVPECTMQTIYHPYCLDHCMDYFGVTVLPSTIPGAGLGLFAVRPFAKGDCICVYSGEQLTAAQLNARYGEETAVYVLQITKDLYIDAIALDSGMGRFANSAYKTTKKNNARFAICKRQAIIRATTTINGSKTSPVEILVPYGAAYWT